MKERLLFCLALMLAASALADEPASTRARNNYMLQCQGCHMADGGGSLGSVPDLRGRMGLFLEVEGGREFLISVPGSAQSPLSDLELAEVLNWMLQEFDPAELAASFSAFSADEVGLHRRPLADVEAVREILMQRIASKGRGAGESRILAVPD